MAKFERRLVPILSLDVAGYTWLIQRDEQAALEAVQGLFDRLVRPAVGERGGVIFKTMGDGLLDR